MTLGYENLLTFFLFFVGIIVVGWAQYKISASYQRYKRIACKNKIAGVEVARKILDANGLSQIHVVETKGELTDHYDPSRKVVRLSTSVFNGENIASVAVAAHECGHAIQDKEGYVFMRIRSALVPVVNLVTYIGYGIAIISLFAGIMGYLKVGVLIILATLIFQLVTLPVEFDASKRALLQLQKLGLVDQGEVEGAREMLKAAAFTYVASFISSIVSLLRLLIMMGNRDE